MYRGRMPILQDCYHMHIFPRYKSDGFGWTFSDGIGEKQSLKEIKDKILYELTD